MIEKKDLRILHANEEAREKTLKEIYNTFCNDQDRIYDLSADHDLYKAIEFLCKWKKIPLIGYDELVTSAGENFTVGDVAKLSHFPLREIKLEPKWLSRDGGDFLGWLQTDDGKIVPIACVAGKRGRYMYYIPGQDDTIKPVTGKIAERLLPEAYMVYRTLGTQKLNRHDFVKFCFSALKAKDIITFLILFAVCTLIGMMVPLLTDSIYDRFISGGEQWNLIQVICVLMAANIAGVIMEVIKNFAYMRVSRRVSYVVQEAVFERIIYLPSGVLRSLSSADLTKRVMDVEQIFEIVFNVLLSSGFTAAFSVCYVVLMFRQRMALASAGIMLTIVMVALLIPIEIRLHKLSGKKLEQDSRLASVSWQMVEGIEKIKETGAEDRALLEYFRSYIDSNNQDVQIQNGVLMVSVMTTAYNIVCSLLFYSIAGKQMNSISVGTFVAFLASFSIFSQAATGLVLAISNASALKPAYKRLQLILETRPDYCKNGTLIRSLEGKVEMDNVTFSYHDGQENILKNITFHAEPGEYIGIAGSSGCGKSTFFRLLLGLEEPQQGEIYYDGHSLKTLDLQNLFSKMGIVLQNGKVFSGSIRDNITFTHPSATDRQIDAVIQAVGLKRDIMRMPMGLNTYISDGGGVLSGGQQQRILLARAIVAEPSVILLDEATSALDNTTQSIVCETLSRLKATKIVIAHRLSTLAACDRVLVMEDGRFVEEGAFQELLDKKGKFYELAERQLL